MIEWRDFGDKDYASADASIGSTRIARVGGAVAQSNPNRLDVLPLVWPSMA